MKVFFDTEFTGLHQSTTLISIGCVTEDGSEFYAELTDFDRILVDQWIQDNVIAHLIYPDDVVNHSNIVMEYPPDIKCTGNTDFVARHLEKWLFDLGSVQMISDCLSYDWVLFCNLWGHAFKIPANVSPAPRDINQDIADCLGIDEEAAFHFSREEFVTVPDNFGQKHNALYDARVIKLCWEKIEACR